MSEELAVLKRDGSTKNRYKYQRLRERLRQAVMNGELAGKLPGERALAQRYGANAKTINKALSDLTTEGLLIRHVGRGTFVAGNGNGDGQHAVRSLRFLWLSEHGPQHIQTQAIYRTTETLLAQQEHRLDQLEHLILDDDGAIAGRSLPPSATRDLAGVVIYASRPSIDLLADLHRRHIPTVLINCRQHRIKTPMVTPDYSQGVFELCEQHIRLGHRDVRLIMDEAWEAAFSQSEIGYQAAMTRHGLRALPVQVADIDFDWNALLRPGTPPFALICIGAGLAAHAMDEGRKRGFTTPVTLSVNALAEPGDSLSQARSLTAYEFPVEDLGRWAAELLVTASPGQLPRTVVVPGRLQDRGSVAPSSAESDLHPGSPSEIVL